MQKVMVLSQHIENNTHIHPIPTYWYLSTYWQRIQIFPQFQHIYLHEYIKDTTYRITSILKVETDIIAIPSICAADKVWITELTLIHKNIRSVRNSYGQVYWSIWRKTHYDVTDKNNNVSSEGIDRHYHTQVFLCKSLKNRTKIYPLA
jgi:hypothetical protein